ncbi:Srb8p KNAG_0I02750 [Huiozyma naganishii CBS 8797]|uniref:Mediator of RNA polymerase II transcription subunit 12 n=1 Tax=Huiozyma naganishii (strain ATCC MYA-139 / BCRC 22969 / CBS 8797 / KCTC 17520 / NBRC 10181 / NCYC 3082 / Yp74L-3) TaxID=1071383 RepID=J7RB10_HUIN7|nr:hypothetical protein KNAG_0I02750 [Kazachstania naganishii CBS 8797]CCK72060.1 hypothetical protein KNAG_0I02750 [Kazachstania naganishii CBS 8797]
MAPSKYVLQPPEDLHPYIPHFSDPDRTQESDDAKVSPTAVYPDFEPWEHKPEEDRILLNFVSKGYYVSSRVNFESISARSSLHESLPKLSDQLALQFGKVLHIRDKEVNRISGSQSTSTDLKPNANKSKHSALSTNPLAGPDFTLPTRVTLTDNRKEMWLQELSSPYTSLSKMLQYIPHGLKRRQVLEQCYTKQIPLKRAIWLIKCCYSIEAQALKSKHTQAINHEGDSTTNEVKTLYKDWTDTYVYILEKLIFEMVQYYNDPNKLKIWKREVAYFLKLLGNCYTLGLLDKEVFYHWLIKFVSKIENFEFLPLSLHILMIFWDDIVGSKISLQVADPRQENTAIDTFLVSKITDILLNKYYVISNSKSMINDEKYIINDIRKNNKIKDSLQSIIGKLVCRLFQEQSLEIFLFPSTSWELYKPCLYEITSHLKDSKSDVKKKLELISYRNDTLKNNSLLTTDEIKKSTSPSTNKSEISQVFTTSTMDPEVKVISILFVDNKFTKLLDENSAEFDWVQYIDQNPLKLSQIFQLLLWSVHPSRLSHYESNQLVAKLLLLQISSLDGFPEFEIEDTIWSLVFQIAKLSKQNMARTINVTELFHLLNILNTYGMIKVPTYIRKLISSGIMYLHDSNDKFFHVKLLINLKISPLMRSQYNMILRNIMEYDPSFYENYNFDQLNNIVTTHKNNVLPGGDLSELTKLPLSCKIILGEWYLNRLCSKSTLDCIDGEQLLRNYEIFCVRLEVFHLFYKWVEFVIYHQLLDDINTMEMLMNILLRYKMVFSQFINDHILFVKTFIYVYINVLKDKDPVAYHVTSFMPFWKFFMKTFPMALTLDSDLRIELSNVYEEEKMKREKLEKNHELVNSLYQSVSHTIDNPKETTMNFTELFHTNIRVLLSLTKQHTYVERRQARCKLLLLMNSNFRDYYKFMSIFLKRNDCDNKGLIRLISEKLLTLDQVRRIQGIEKVLELIDLGDLLMCHEIYFQTHKYDYIKGNFETILKTCQEHLPQRYHLFLRILAQFGPNTNFSKLSTRAIQTMAERNGKPMADFVHDLLFYGLKSEDGDDTDDELFESESSPSDMFYLLEFTNLWVFQAITAHQVRVMTNVYGDNISGLQAALRQFIFDVIEVSKYNELCSQLFDAVEDASSIRQIIEIVEEDFFAKCLEGDERANRRDYLIIVIELVASFSKKVEGSSASSTDIPCRSLPALQAVIYGYDVLSEVELSGLELQMTVVIKVFTMHMNAIFQDIVEGLQDPMRRQSTESFLVSVSHLFERISFNLRLKLMVYELLTSLKSYCIYASTTPHERAALGPGSSSERHTFEIPNIILNVPPFQVSSFNMNKNSSETDPVSTEGNTAATSRSPLSLGITKVRSGGTRATNTTRGRWFLYNTKSAQYDCPLAVEPYHNIANDQVKQERAVNNTCFSLSLFAATFERGNPPR